MRFGIYGMAVAVLLMAGCSTPQDRAKENPAAFSKIPADQRDRVLKGNIAVGDSSHAVYVALGRPYRVLKGQRGTDLELRWVYARIESYTVQSIQTRAAVAPDGRVFYFHDWVPEQQSQMIPSFEVTFKGDRVVAWREL